MTCADRNFSLDIRAQAPGEHNLSEPFQFPEFLGKLVISIASGPGRPSTPHP